MLNTPSLLPWIIWNVSLAPAVLNVWEGLKAVKFDCTFKSVADRAAAVGLVAECCRVCREELVKEILSSPWELRVDKYSHYSSLVVMRLIIITSTVKLHCGMKMLVFFVWIWWVLLESVCSENRWKISVWWTFSLQMFLFLTNTQRRTFRFSIFLFLRPLVCPCGDLWPLLFESWHDSNLSSLPLHWWNAALCWRRYNTEMRRKQHLYLLLRIKR